MRYVIAFMMMMSGCAASPPPVPPAVIVTVPEAAPQQPKPDPSVNRLVAEADTARKTVTDGALKGHQSNGFLIQIIGLTHNLDVAVAILKRKHTPQNMARLHKAINDLEEAARRAPPFDYNLPLDGK